MTDNYQNVEQIRCFLQGEKQITVPFSLRNSDIDYVCTDVLRLLPSKRLVLEANTTSQHVVIKLFSPSQKGQRALEREKQGHKLASDAGLYVPELLLTSDNMEGCLAIVYKFVENAKAFTLHGEHNYAERVAKLLELQAKLHRYGIYQDDIHMNNILTVGDKLYLIDLGSVICEQQGVTLSQTTSLANLAKLVAQFTPIEQTELVKHLAVYYRERGWLFNDKKHDYFLKLVEKAWQKRKTQYLKKCFRSCTMTTYGHSVTREFAFRNDFLSGLSVDLVRDIDTLMSHSDLIKAGNSATVVRTDLDGKQLVIKRYNIKNICHFLRRCLRPSRAARSWRNANLLEFISLPTPKPLGFIEHRVGWFRYTAYFITEYTQAEELLTVYQRRQPSDDELDQISNIFGLLQKSQISHGDLKATNLLIDGAGKVLMIDLDAMQEHMSYKSFQRAFNKDKNRFIRNWQDLKIKKIFTTLIF